MGPKRRLFIAINLSEPIKKKLLALQKEWANLPVRWVKPAQLHLTLAFIGYVSDEEMLEICHLVREIARINQVLEINFRKVCLGPFNKPPRLIWLEGEENPLLNKLKSDLEQGLAKLVQGVYQPEKRAFCPHITLARIRQFDWQKLPVKPQIDREINLSFLVNSIEVMESHLKRSGAEYAVLESAALEE